MRVLLALISIGLGVAAADVQAGTLYRCDGADGSRSYSSKRVAGATCKAVANYSPQRSANWRPVRNAGAASIEPIKPASTPLLSATTASVVPTQAAASAPQTPSTRRVSGQIYTYQKNGVTYATTTRPRGVAASAMRAIPYSFIETCYACGAQPGVNFGRLRLNTNAYQAEIAEAARTHGVDPAVIRAIMHAESAYNPNALSHAGAQGLMQLMPATARRFGVTNAYDPRQNIQGGVQYLAWLLRRFNGDLTLASAGYNAGEGAVDRHKGVPPYRETQRYVERVRILADRYRQEIASN